MKIPWGDIIRLILKALGRGKPRKPKEVYDAEPESVENNTLNDDIDVLRGGMRDDK